jgi:integrase/recombinase XerD
MRRDMGNRVTLRHVQTVRKGGKVYRYLRVPGRDRVRLPDVEPAHPDFLAAYLAALDAKPAPKRRPGTIAAAVEAYLRSAAHEALSPDYRRLIRKEAEAIAARGGDARAADLRARHIGADLAPLTPFRARNRLAAWRYVCGHAAQIGMLTDNPASEVKPKKLPKSDGFPPWTADEIERFRAHWPAGTVQRLAFELLFWTGCRIGDAVKLGPQHVARDGVLEFAQSKTGNPACVPWTCALPAYAAGMEADRDAMHAAIAAHPSGHLTWLATAWGRPRSAPGLGNLMTAAAQAAGLAKSAHGLRKARSVALAEAGATAHQISAWTGHETLREVARYTRAADRRRAVIGTEPARDSVNRGGEVYRKAENP